MLISPKTLKKRVSGELARKFRQVADIEKHHEERYLRLLANIEEELVFKRDNEETMALPQLRTYPCRQERTQGLHRLRTSRIILRAESHQLLDNSCSAFTRQSYQTCRYGTPLPACFSFPNFSAP